MSTSPAEHRAGAGPTQSVNPGLTTGEARRRRTADGPNALPTPRPPSPVLLLLGQLTHFFALMLWVAAGLAFVGGMPQLAVAIAVVVLVNGAFAFAQEYRADRAGQRLRELLPMRATVVRDGRRQEIPAAELVRGDLVLLTAGDRISADLALEHVDGLAVDESTLTGESVPVRPEPDARVYAGTFVSRGEARAVVAAIGAGTRLAGIAAMTRERPAPSRAARRPAEPGRAGHRRGRARRGCAVLRRRAVAGHGSDPGLPARGRRHRRAGPGRPAAHRHPLARPGRTHHGRPQCAGAPARVGRDARLHHDDLHRQDGHPDGEPDVGGAGLDPHRRRVRGRTRLRTPRRGHPGREGRGRGGGARDRGRAVRRGPGGPQGRALVLARRSDGGRPARARHARRPGPPGRRGGPTRAATGLVRPRAPAQPGRRRCVGGGLGTGDRGTGCRPATVHRRRHDGAGGGRGRGVGAAGPAGARGGGRPASGRHGVGQRTRGSGERAATARAGRPAGPPAGGRRRGGAQLPQRPHRPHHDHRRPSGHRAGHRRPGGSVAAGQPRPASPTSCPPTRPPSATRSTPTAP